MQFYLLHKNINDLLYINDYQNYISKIEETINNNRIRIKGLEIEYNTIVPQLDEMVVLEEKREAEGWVAGKYPKEDTKK